MILLPLTFENVLPVAYNARQSDREEIGATMPAYSSSAVAAIFAGARIGFVAAADDGTPVLAFAAHESWPGVWGIGLVATDRIGEVILPAMKLAKRIRQQLTDLGAHRGHAFASAKNLAAQKLLKIMGATPEATLRGWGRGGLDFIVFTWWSKSHVHLQSTQASQA